MLTNTTGTGGGIGRGLGGGFGGGTGGKNSPNANKIFTYPIQL